MRTIEYTKRVTKNIRPSWSHVVDNQKQYEFGMIDRDGDARYVPFYDESGLTANKLRCDRFYVISHEYGPARIVHARAEHDAYNVHLDESKTIPESELVEAYNVADMLEKHLIKKGNQDGGHMIDFCRRFAQTYFDMLTARREYDKLELDEAYRHQSNTTGTGIVEVGHYEHIETIPLSRLAIRRKPQTPVEKFCRKAGL